MKQITHMSEELKVKEVTLLVQGHVVSKGRTEAQGLILSDHVVQSVLLVVFNTDFSLFSKFVLVSREDKDDPNIFHLLQKLWQLLIPRTTLNNRSEIKTSTVISWWKHVTTV